MVGAGMTIIEATNDLTPKELIFTRKLFKSLGEVEELSSDLMGIGGTLSGCGPAWIFMVIEALADGAVYHGLPRDIAYKLGEPDRYRFRKNGTGYETASGQTQRRRLFTGRHHHPWRESAGRRGPAHCHDECRRRGVQKTGLTPELFIVEKG